MEPVDSLQDSLRNSTTTGGGEGVNGLFLRGIRNTRITDDERMQLIVNELNLVGKEIENKKTQVHLKANFYHVINTLSSLIILICAAISLGIEAASDCRSIPVIALASVIFVVEGTHKLCRWGPLGTLYKTANIQLNRIFRQCREYMYFFERYTPEQLFSLVMTLRSQCDDVDSELFNLSMAGAGRYAANFDVEPNTSLSATSPEINHSSAATRTANSPIHIHINSPSATQLPNSPIRVNDEPLIVSRSPNSVRVIIDNDSDELPSVQSPSVQLPSVQLPAVQSPVHIPNKK